jgi:nucleotide-binding universal stress UspA family protein
MDKNVNKKVRVALKKILVPVDKSGNKEKIISYAIFLANAAQKKAQIIAINVIYPGISVARDKEKQQAKELLNEIHRLAKKEGVNIKIEVVEGELVSDTIADYAKKNNMDAIVIGTKGMTEKEDLALGSTVNKVIHYAHCPVFAIR